MDLNPLADVGTTLVHSALLLLLHPCMFALDFQVELLRYSNTIQHHLHLQMQKRFQMDSLPTREQFLQRLLKVSIRDLPLNELSCQFCGRDYLGTAHDDGLEHPAGLSCGHAFGVTCIRSWLQYNNTCPQCQEVVYQRSEDSDQPTANTEAATELKYYGRQISTNDRHNLRDILRAKDEVDECFERGDNQAWGVAVENRYYLILGRAHFFSTGQLKVIIAEYGFHRMPSNTRLRWLPKQAKLINATILVDKLQRLWDKLFETYSHRMYQKGKLEAQKNKFSAACHPLSGWMWYTITATIQRLEGRHMTARDLESELNAAFSRSELRAHLEHLQKIGQYPEGFHIYRSQLHEAILRKLIGIGDEHVATKPKGWVSRY